MKTKKKQRKITIVQLSVVEKKLVVLQHKQATIAKQITPLKITVRKYICQNMEAIETYLASGHKYGMVGWAVDKIKRGYFGTDVKMHQLKNIISELREAGL